ncbi:MAG: hypothetical protein WC076_08725 [Terrimicrobiaceae bacterium]|nr:hypothetical protein [Terrimicrobiaceae bacterium]
MNSNHKTGQNGVPNDAAGPSPLRPFQRASSLITTLLVLVVLSTIVVAFMQSMSIERSVARSAKNRLVADLAARAALAEATSRILGADQGFPIGAYEELAVGYQSNVTNAPYLTLLKPKADWSGVQERCYLVSSQSKSTAPDSSIAAKSVDVNSPIDGAISGWIGLTTSNGIRRTVPAEWITLRDSGGNITARYAFWVDDESARIDILSAGSVDTTPQKNHLRQSGYHASEISMHGLFGTGTNVSSYLTSRLNSANVPLGSLGFAQIAAHAPGGAIAWNGGLDILRASVGIGSIPDERGALGIRKLDLNSWAETNSAFNTPSARDLLAKKIIALGDFIDQADPGFGTRYFDGATGTDARNYCIKLAANIQDYIDPDSQPSVIRNNLGGWLEPPNPSVIGEGAPSLPPVAFGKEVVPTIGEYLGYYYNDAGFLRIDHTFEVWNLHSQSIDFQALGSARILVAERNDVTPRAGSDAVDPDLPGEPGNPPLTLNLPAGGTLPAGRYSLLTTLPAGSALESQWVVGAPNRIPLDRTEPTYAYGSGGLYMNGDTLATLADVDTEIVIANQFGYLDIQARVAQQGPVNLRATDSTRFIATQPFGNDPSSSGNNTDRRYPLDSGDPRALTEVFPAYSESGGSSSAIAWRRNTANSPGATRLGGDSNGGTYGILPSNSGSDTNAFVPEPVPNPDMASADDAVSIIRNGPMRTEAELAFIYDPAIPGSGNANANVRNRGGFRTLAIGSKLGEKSGPARLAHVDEKNRASRLLELFTAENTQPRQKLLLNSVLRNPQNLPWRALLDRLITQTNSASTLEYAGPKDPDFPVAGLSVVPDELVKAIEAKARGAGGTPGSPFFFIGQLADLDVFNTGSLLLKSIATSTPFDLTPDAANKKLLDRGREEVFRRLAGLLTLKGSTYRVYSIGQAVKELPDGSLRILATSNLLTLCQIERDYPTTNALANLTMPALLTNNRSTNARSKLILQLQQ